MIAFAVMSGEKMKLLDRIDRVNVLGAAWGPCEAFVWLSLVVISLVTTVFMGVSSGGFSGELIWSIAVLLTSLALCGATKEVEVGAGMLNTSGARVQP